MINWNLLEILFKRFHSEIPTLRIPDPVIWDEVWEVVSKFPGDADTADLRTKIKNHHA